MPQTINFVQEIVENRNSINIYAKFHEAHYKVIDLVLTIFQKTFNFLKIT